MFSVVTTLYNSSSHIDEFYRRMTAALQRVSGEYEIILVNDGSPDNSLEKAVAIQQSDSRVSVIDLSKNFGQHKAIMTGLRYVKGDYVFLVEIDLEELPEWIVDFYATLMDNKDVDVIYGVQDSRKGGAFERVSGSIFYRIFNLFAEVKMPENHVTARLMTSRYVRALLEYKDKALFLGGVYELVGFKSKPHSITKLSHSETTYSMARKIRLLVDAITSFSVAPLWGVFIAGFLVSLFSILVIIFLIIKAYLGTEVGWPSIVASIWAVGGILMLSVGIVGIYLKKVFDEVKDRPFTTIKHIYARDDKD